MALTCELHTAYIYERGGRKKLGQLDQLTRVRWGRKRDDPSTGTVFVSAPGLECAKVLGLAETNRTELVVFRGAQRVWEGPITRITYQGDGVELEARDVMVYVVRTIMRDEYDNRHPNVSTVLARVERIMNAELARKESLDPPVNVLPHVQYVYAEGSRTYERTYYDAAAVKSALAGAGSVAEMTAVLEPLRVEYGLTEITVPTHTSAHGISWALPVHQDWRLRQYMQAMVDAFTKYPPSFIKTAGIERVYFVKDLQMNTGFNVGGAAVDRTFFVDVADYADGPDMVFDSEHIIHHELNHLMLNQFGSTLIEQRWLALNPAGFTYGVGWDTPDYGLNPPGFVRDYSRYSYAEDLAEVAGLLFADSMQAFRDMLEGSDPVVVQKIGLYQEWMASISTGVIDADAYYEALHSGVVVVPGESGVTDARTSAHTLPYEMTVFQHLDTYAARGGIDYTVLGRSIIFFDVHTRIGQTPMVTAGDFIGDPIITQYGMELTTYVAHTDGKGNWGAAGGTDEYYGEWEVLHQAYDENAGPADENEPPSVAELESQAQRSYAQGSKPPLVVRIPDNTRLNPNGVLTIDDLVPGIWIPLSATLPGRSVSQMQKLDSMTVEETAEDGEVIKVVLSPAYADKAVEETE